MGLSDRVLGLAQSSMAIVCKKNLFELLSLGFEALLGTSLCNCKIKGWMSLTNNITKQKLFCRAKLMGEAKSHTYLIFIHLVEDLEIIN